MAKAKKQRVTVKPPAEPRSYFSMQVNGHSLSAEMHDSQWCFECQEWPEIATKWNGDTILDNAVADFMTRALAGAVTVRVLAKGVTGGSS